MLQRIRRTLRQKDDIGVPGPGLRLAEPSPEGPEQAWRIEAEQIKLLYTQAPIGFVAGTAVVSLVPFVLWDAVERGLLLAWAVFMIAATLPPFVVMWRYPRLALAADDVRPWRRLFIAGYAFSGTAWGSAGVLLFPAGSVAYQVFLIFAIGGVTAGAVTVVSSVFAAYLAFVVPAMLPIIVRLFVHGGDLSIAMALALGAFSGALVGVARHLHASFTESVGLRFANLDLIDSLSAAKAQADAAREQAEAASRAKSQFLANMSHELRTPLHGVLGMLEVLLHTPLTDRQRRMAKRAFRSGQMQLAIVNDLLDFAKIEAGRLELEVADVDLRQLAAEVVEIFAETAHRKGFDLGYVVHDEVPPVLQGDPGRLRQVLTNLVGNAVKFTERGGVLVRVSATVADPRAPEDHVVLVAVRDTGIGIAEAAQRGIFEPFVQANGVMARRYGGTGLGLAIARQLVRMMGGDLWLESAPGRGSTFSFTVPMRAAAAASADQAAGGGPAARPDFLPSLHGRVLLVEDNDVNQEVARAMLEDAGCHVDVAADGRVALERLLTERFDLVLMDCQMPEVDGFELTRRIRDREQGREAGPGGPALVRMAPGARRTPIVALTANAMRGDRERCLAAGMDDYLSKPFSERQLREILSRWLPAAPPGQSEGASTAPSEASPAGPDCAGGAGARATATQAPGALLGHAPRKAQEDAGRPLGRPEVQETGGAPPVSPIDLQALDRIRALGRSGVSDLAGKIVRLYLAGSARLVQEIRDAVGRHDAAALREAAHTLRSSSASVGALGLAELCADLEALGRSERVEEASRRLDELAAEHQAVREALTRELDARPVPPAGRPG